MPQMRRHGRHHQARHKCSIRRLGGGCFVVSGQKPRDLMQQRRQVGLKIVQNQVNSCLWQITFSYVFICFFTLFFNQLLRTYVVCLLEAMTMSLIMNQQTFLVGDLEHVLFFPHLWNVIIPTEEQLYCSEGQAHTPPTVTLIWGTSYQLVYKPHELQRYHL